MNIDFHPDLMFPTRASTIWLMHLEIRGFAPGIQGTRPRLARWEGATQPAAAPAGGAGAGGRTQACLLRVRGREVVSARAPDDELSDGQLLALPHNHHVPADIFH